MILNKFNNMKVHAAISVILLSLAICIISLVARSDKNIINNAMHSILKKTEFIPFWTVSPDHHYLNVYAIPVNETLREHVAQRLAVNLPKDYEPAIKLTYPIASHNISEQKLTARVQSDLSALQHNEKPSTTGTAKIVPILSADGFELVTQYGFLIILWKLSYLLIFPVGLLLIIGLLAFSLKHYTLSHMMIALSFLLVVAYYLNRGDSPTAKRWESDKSALYTIATHSQEDLPCQIK